MQQVLLGFEISQEGFEFGYLIYHKGRDSNYVVVTHWVQENMLRMIAYKAEKETPYQFQAVTHTGLVICVWDMQIHHHERNAFVKHILEKPKRPAIKKYLEDVYRS